MFTHDGMTTEQTPTDDDFADMERRPGRGGGAVIVWCIVGIGAGAIVAALALIGRG